MALAQYCRSYIRFLFGQRMLQATQRLAGLINSQTQFNTVTRLGVTALSTTLEMTATLNQDYGLKLAKLKQYHKAYFEILKSNRFDPSHFGIIASQDMSITGHYLCNYRFFIIWSHVIKLRHTVYYTLHYRFSLKKEVILDVYLSPEQ